MINPEKRPSTLQYLGFILLLGCLSIPTNSISEVKTTGNLIVNPDFETGNLDGWTSSGDVQVINDCCILNNVPSNYDVEFGDSGAIEQDFNLVTDSISQPMLDNGISLQSVIEVQNGEGGEGGWAPNRGGADSFTINLQIKDSESNVLASSSQTRNTTTDIHGQLFQDTVIYGGTGSNIGNITISGIDANAPSTLGGSNIDNVSVTMTYDDTVLTAIQTEELNITTEELITTFEEIEEYIGIVEEFIPEEIETVNVEEMTFEELITELPEIIELTEEEEFMEETIVLSPEVFEETIIETETPGQSEEENIQVVEEVFEELEVESISESNEEAINEEVVENETNEERLERNSDESEETITTEESESPEETEVAVNDRPSISVEDITKKVSEKIESVEGQIIAVQMVVAKLMDSNNMVSSYSNINQDIFKQTMIADRNIDSYTNIIYEDNRLIYSDINLEDRLEWISR